MFSSPQLLHHYDEDEEDYYDPSEEDEDQQHHFFTRNRSYSYQYQPNRFPEVTCRKAYFSHHPTNTRSYFGVPGMSLPPLPTTNVPTLSNASVSTVHSTDLLYSPISFPSSPPMSYPSSPTSREHHTVWHHQQQRRQSHHKLEQEDLVPFRLRSQSSLNIKHPLVPAIDVPLFPPHYEKRAFESSAAITKLKVRYFGAIYIVVVLNDIGFMELQKRIESKIKFALIGLKYEDEVGDLITILGESVRHFINNCVYKMMI